jgi:pyruvate dehydrogenase E2 component (dihydrolipoamide acetyltransferase)
MPRQGNTVESCIITNWKVKEGDSVAPETTICEVETDKAAFEIPAGTAGTVLKLLFAAGDDVPVLKPIAVIGAAGENWQVVLGNGEWGMGNGELRSDNSMPDTNNSQSPLPTPQSPLPVSRLQVSTPHSPLPIPHSTISPRARNLAGREALPLEMVSGTGPGGRIIERDVTAALQNRPPLTAAAKAAGPATVPPIGSGIGGRVTAADLAASPLPAPHSPLPTPHSLQFAEGAVTETPIKGIRKIIADRMYKSLAESAQLTINASAAAVKLQEIRSGIKAQTSLAEELGLSKITINDLVLFAVSRTLPRFPFMNAHKIGETIKTFERVHLAVAVDTPRGLMVPVIRNANLLSLARISSEAKRLAAACQNGTANPDELSGSTFTVSNLGNFGITSFTPVLNAPEVAILGVCGIELKPVALASGDADDCNCGVRFEPQIGFSLTINHQAIDGAPAARFLKSLCDAIAHIDLLLAAG